MSVPKHKSGFSLVEIMVAILVLLVLVLGTSALLSQVGGSIRVQGHTRVAMEVVNEVLEHTSNQDYSSLSDFSTNFVRNGISYTVQTTVSPVSGLLRSRVTTQVSYKGQDILADTIVIAGTEIQN